MLLAQIPIALLGAVAEFALPDQVPASVRTAYDAASSDVSTNWLIASGLLAVVLVVIALATLVGLYKFRPWARRANLVVGALSLVVTVMMGYFVESGLSTACYTACSYLWGATTAMTYFSDLASRFDKTTGTDAQ